MLNKFDHKFKSNRPLPAPLKMKNPHRKKLFQNRLQNSRLNRAEEEISSSPSLEGGASLSNVHTQLPSLELTHTRNEADFLVWELRFFPFTSD